MSLDGLSQHAISALSFNSLRVLFLDTRHVTCFPRKTALYWSLWCCLCVCSESLGVLSMFPVCLYMLCLLMQSLRVLWNLFVRSPSSHFSRQKSQTFESLERSLCFLCDSLHVVSAISVWSLEYLRALSLDAFSRQKSHISETLVCS